MLESLAPWGLQLQRKFEPFLQSIEDALILCLRSIVMLQFGIRGIRTQPFHFKRYSISFFINEAVKLSCMY